MNPHTGLRRVLSGLFDRVLLWHSDRPLRQQLRAYRRQNRQQRRRWLGRGERP